MIRVTVEEAPLPTFVEKQAIDPSLIVQPAPCTLPGDSGGTTYVTFLNERGLRQLARLLHLRPGDG